MSKNSVEKNFGANPYKKGDPRRAAFQVGGPSAVARGFNTGEEYNTWRKAGDRADFVNRVVLPTAGFVGGGAAMAALAGTGGAGAVAGGLPANMLPGGATLSTAAPSAAGTFAAGLPAGMLPGGATMEALASAPTAAGYAPYAASVSPMSVANGSGSLGARLGMAGGSMDNLLKLGKMGVDLGAGIWANKSAAASDRASLAAQQRSQAELLAWEKERDRLDRQAKADYDAEMKRQWDVQQQNAQRQEELDLLRYGDSEARRAPYREAGYNAMARLAGINGLPIPNRPAPAQAPAFISRNTTPAMGGLPTYRG